MKKEICIEKELPAHTISVSRGIADNGLGEEPTYLLEIRYKSLYRLKRRRDVHMRFSADTMNDILNLFNTIIHKQGS